MENLKKEMLKNELSILGVNEVWWKGQDEIKSGDYIQCIIQEMNGLKEA